jgi:hypothetical protein
VIRIFTAEDLTGISITIDGQLVNDCVETVETCSRQALGEGRPVHLYLRDVSYIDERGRTLLSRLASRGVQLSASGVYSSWIVAEISREQTTCSDRRQRADKRLRNCS